MVFLDIWRSYRSLPVWVQIWVAGILVPVNMAALAGPGTPQGLWVAALAIGGMLPNVAIMLYERGLSKMMAFPHLLPWSALVLWLLLAMPDGGAVFRAYLWVLLAVDGLSLAFDYSDALKWIRGDRSIAGA